MCGICGFVNLDGAPASPAVLGRMQAAIHHRGPDSQGRHLEGVDGAAGGLPPVGIASTRLKIIDLTESARQPLSNEDDTLWIVFNGEIYNYQALAARLAARGHRFKSRSDTEVILHLYEERGEACVEELDGMFAFALWDRRQGSLFLARDRVGKKPLFYATDGKAFLFGSEVKALLQHPAGPAEIDEGALAPYFVFGYVPGPRSFYKGVRKLPPGHTLTLAADGALRLREYWDLRFPPEPAGARHPTDGAESAPRVRELLTEAVRKRLISDVPLGAFLSGGIDSSIVVGLMSRLMAAPVRTFTIGFRDAPAYDETGYARAVARRFGTDHTEFLVEPEVTDLIEPLVWHHDGPFRDTSAIPTFVVSRLAREHVTVVLNGDGGDELFAGYRRFHATLLAERLPRLPLRLADAVLARLPRRADQRATLDRLTRFVRAARLPFYERFSEGFGAADLDLDRLLRPEVLPPAEERGQTAHFAPYLDRVRDCSPLSRLLYLNFKTYLVEDLLVKMDRCTMAHALEARSPFLDPALVEFAAGLPDALKLAGRRSKVILRRAFADLLPPEIDRRGKMGFGVPMAMWLRTGLRKVLRDVLLQPQPRLADYVRGEHVRALVDDHLAGRADHGGRLWALLTLEIWLEQLPSWRRPLPGHP